MDGNQRPPESHSQEGTASLASDSLHRRLRVRRPWAKVGSKCHLAGHARGPGDPGLTMGLHKLLGWGLHTSPTQAPRGVALCERTVFSSWFVRKAAVRTPGWGRIAARALGLSSSTAVSGKTGTDTVELVLLGQQLLWPLWGVGLRKAVASSTALTATPWSPCPQTERRAGDCLLS